MPGVGVFGRVVRQGRESRWRRLRGGAAAEPVAPAYLLECVRLWRADHPALARGVALAAVIVGLVVTIAAPLIWIGGGVQVALRNLDKIDIPTFTSP